MNAALLILFGFFDGTSAPAAPQATRLDDDAGSGWRKHRKDWKKLQKQELKRLLEEVGEVPEKAKQVAAIKAQHQKPRAPRKPGVPFVYQEPQTDYAALTADIQAVQFLLDAFADLERARERELLIQLGIERRLLDDDEDAFMLLM